MSHTLLLLAGGSGSRMGKPVNKVLLPLGGQSCLRRSLQAFIPFVERIIIVFRPVDETAIREEIGQLNLSIPLFFSYGGSSRQASVYNGLQAVPWQEGEIVLVHDAARCLVDADTIREAISSCEQYGSGVPCLPVTDTIKEMSDHGGCARLLDRTRLRAIQTPQVFLAPELLRLEQRALEEGYEGTDDASIFEHYGIPVHYSMGNSRNIKLTTQEDYHMAQAWLQESATPLRIGHGYDVHRLVEGRKLILCGVEIPHSLGLLGHSDADVALHALMDAMLGAAAAGDIGQHFPDSDEQYRGISSLRLLQCTLEILHSNHFRVVNVDLTLMAQRPKLAPFIVQMRENIAKTLALPMDCVSVKATTTEHLGFEGREEGISAHAICLLTREDS